MRISDWSSDVCSSDLADEQAEVGKPGPGGAHPVRRITPGSGVDRSVGAVVGQEGKGQEQGEQAERRRRGDHQRSRDALTENGAPVGFTRPGPAGLPAELVLPPFSLPHYPLPPPDPTTTSE